MMTNNKFGYIYYEYPAAKGSFPIGKKPVSLDGLGFYVCERGHVDINLDNQIIRLTPNNICVVLPCSILGVEGYSEDFRGFGARASILFIDELFIPNIGNYYSYIRNHPISGINADHLLSLKDIISVINIKLRGIPDDLAQNVAQNLLNALAYEIISCYNPEETNDKSTRQDEIFRSFMQLVYRDHKKERSLAYYADTLCLSTRYLSSVIKEKTGYSASYWIESTVISEAKSMLRNSNLTVMQISEELSFANPSFFGQYFKKYAGATPYDYRRGKE